MPDSTLPLQLDDLRAPEGPWPGDQPVTVRAGFRVAEALAFDVDACVEIFPAAGGEPLYRRHSGEDGHDFCWLPRGRYELDWHAPRLKLAPGAYRLVMTLQHRVAGAPASGGRAELAFEVAEGAAAGLLTSRWHLEAPTGPPVHDLSWSRGPADWFHRHFDHAARTVISYMLGDSPLLRGRVLDVGCGDGITDLGIFLRCRPQELVGIDPFRGYERLPQLMADNHLPLDGLPDGLRFLPADGNHIPFPDDAFDVVLSWGSLEHIAGGYLQTLREIKRVLRPDGLLFAHPGLYYSNFGHHLGEFTDEPFVHLTRSEEELRRLVLETPPRYMDRAGEFSPPEDYWRWFKELNPITVAGFEQELRALEFDFYRVALRTEDLIEYHHPSLQAYGMQDLATVELYLSAFNRKRPPPPGFSTEERGP